MQKRLLLLGQSPDSDSLGLFFPAQLTPEAVRSCCLVSPTILPGEFDAVVSAIAESATAEHELRTKVLTPFWLLVRETAESTDLEPDALAARCKRIASLYRAAFENLVDGDRAIFETELAKRIGKERALAISVELATFVRIDPCRIFGIGPPSTVTSPVRVLLETLATMRSMPSDKDAMVPAGRIIIDASDELSLAYSEVVNRRMRALADARARSQAYKSPPSNSDEERADRRARIAAAEQRADASRRPVGDAFLRVGDLHKRLLQNLLAAMPPEFAAQYEQTYLVQAIGTLSRCPWDPIPVLREFSARSTATPEFIATVNATQAENLRQYQAEVLRALDVHLLEIIREPLGFQKRSKAKAQAAVVDAQDAAHRRALALILQAEGFVASEAREEWQKAIAGWEHAGTEQAAGSLKDSYLFP
jgi:hypothetical protein